jgi:hypothetical protein
MAIDLEKFLPPTPDEILNFGKNVVTDVVDTGIEVLRKPSELATKLNENIKRLGR